VQPGPMTAELQLTRSRSSWSATQDEVWLALDLEKAGPKLTHSPISIGIVLGDADGHVLYMARIDMKCGDKPSDVDQETMNWWRKLHWPLWKQLQGPSALSPEVAFRQFREVLENIYEQHSEVYLLTTAPAFDLGQLDYYDTLYNEKAKGVRYALNGRRYRDMNPAERLAALPVNEQRRIRVELANEQEHHRHQQRHDPSYDALYAYRMAMKLPSHARRPRPNS
jgi:hypothetical protein